jgi:SNW domain-containing protein 1
MALREKADREEQLREMANRARLERAGVSLDSEQKQGGSGSYYEPQTGGAGGLGQFVRRDTTEEDEDEEDIDGFEEETEEEKIARQQRERIRMEQRKEREREIRLENMKVLFYIYILFSRRLIAIFKFND